MSDQTQEERAKEDLLLWILYKHQGAKSETGQMIRKHLGMTQFQTLTTEQVERARRVSW